jgi:Primase C terminal 2 (PriCT-2)/RepB DNA-primase from phage plasmid
MKPMHLWTTEDFALAREGSKRNRARLKIDAVVDAEYTDVTDSAPRTKTKRGKSKPEQATVIARPSVDLDMAREFLTALDPEAGAFCFFTLEDDKTRKGEKPQEFPAGGLRTFLPTLEKLNRAGRGVFVTPNEMNGEGRNDQKGQFTRYRFVWADMDGAPLPKSWPLLPSIEVESSPGKFHVYWRIAGDIEPAQWATAMRGLVTGFGADDNATDRVRVLRVPGFVHQKDPARPFLAKLLSTSDAAYTADELLAAFPVKEVAKSSSKSKASSVPTSLRNALGMGITAEKREQLFAIPVDLGEGQSSKPWATVGMIIHHETSGGDDGLALWIEWSRRSKDFDEAECRKRWRGFEPSGEATGSGAWVAESELACRDRSGT